MVLTGYARLIVSDLAPRQIVDPALVAAGDPAEIAAACLATVDPALAERVREGDLLVVAGELRAGPGAEEAVIALQAAGFAAAIARQVASELWAIGARYGLPLLALDTAIAEGALIRLDLERGRVEVGGATWMFEPLASEGLAAVRRGQLLARMRRVAEDEGYAE